jgi:hypothetical protein
VEVHMFIEPSTEGSGDRLACMTFVAIILMVIAGIYLLTGKRDTVQPDEPEHHHVVEEEEDEETWRLDDREVDDEPDEEE